MNIDVDLGRLLPGRSSPRPHEQLVIKAPPHSNDPQIGTRRCHRLRAKSLSIAIVALCSVCIGLPLRSQEQSADSARGSILWILNRLYVAHEFPDVREFAAGEFLAQQADRPTLGASLIPGTSVTSRVLHRDDTTAVATTHLTDSHNDLDCYTFFRRDTAGWKIIAVRYALLPSFFYAALDSLDALPFASDTVIWDRARMHLTMESDAQLTRYFVQHDTAFQRLADSFLAQTAVTVLDDRGRRPDGMAAVGLTSIRDAMRDLHVGVLGRVSTTPG